MNIQAKKKKIRLRPINTENKLMVARGKGVMDGQNARRGVVDILLNE